LDLLVDQLTLVVLAHVGDPGQGDAKGAEQEAEAGPHAHARQGFVVVLQGDVSGVQALLRRVLRVSIVEE